MSHESMWFTVKSSHFSIILTSFLFSVINTVIISDSAGRSVLLQCTEVKKMCDLGENGEGDVNFEKVKKQSRCTSLSLGSLAEGV